MVQILNGGIRWGVFCSLILYAVCDNTPCTGTSTAISCQNGVTLDQITAYITQSVNSRQIVELYIKNASLPVLTDHLLIQLPNLKILSILQSDLQDIQPKAFAAVKELKYLDLSYNKLTELKRNVFESLVSLKVLDLYENRIHKIDPGALHPLRALTSINLEGNRLRNMDNASLPETDALTELNLRHNQIRKMAPFTFGGVPNLSRLEIAGNVLNCLENRTFHGLSKLETLDLHKLFITEIKYFAFYKMQGLRMLNLSMNNIRSLEAPMFYSLESLQTIDLRDNDAIQKVEFPFLNFISVQNLYLPEYLYQNFIQWGFFSGLASLKRLDLSGYGLNYTSEFQFQGLDSVESLDLSCNAYKNITENMFFPMPCLTTLNLTLNHINNIQNDSFYKLQKLSMLNLSYNHLKVFEFNYYDIPLELLDLQSNPHLSEIFPAESSLKSLRELYIQNDNFTRFPHVNFVNLEIIDIRNNSLDDFKFEVIIKHNKNLKKMLLQNNPWKCTRLTLLLKQLKKRNIIFKEPNDILNEGIQNVDGIKCV